MKHICVFCGSSIGAREIYRDTARALGGEIARRGIDLVYGGSNIGLMGVIADATLAAGGKATGIMPTHLIQKEIMHTHLTELRVVNTMHERKALMADLADGFIALPGGFGTYDEFCEIVTWAQLGLHQKPCALLNVEGYYDPLITMIDRAVQEGFVRADHRAMLIISAEISDLLDQMQNYRAQAVRK
ncbi:MAG: Rossman fold protein, TIGR00730 family [Chloroflexi bacterium UTCFX4]|nr:MAG: Rossman fold protein, TIGR00730 family [Chloroflexi bacterium UTCFX4]